jgi:polysaccharide biosynthesis/export protein
MFETQQEKTMSCTIPRVLFLAAVLAANAFGDDQKPRPEQAPAFGDAEYKLGPGDVMEVFVWKEPDLTATVVVRPDGKISLPLIGEFDATGKTVAELQKEVTAGLGRYLAEPVVNVMLKEVNSPRVSVLGNVRKPDVYKMQHKITVLDAIALAGGFTEFARRDRVYVIRNGSKGTQKIKVNLKRLLDESGGDLLYLQQSDTVYVE